MKLFTRLFLFLLVLFLLHGDFTSALLAQSKKTSKNSARKKRVKTFRADFRDQDIQDFLKAMSAVIGQNIMVDDRIHGKITVISPKPIPVSQAYGYLLSVLSMKGMSLVNEDGILKVLPLKEAIARDYNIHYGRTPFVREENSSSIITHVVPLLDAKPSRLAPLLKRVTGPNTELIDYDDNNLLIITGELQEVNRLVSIIDMVDKEKPKDDDTQSYGDIHLIRLEHMQADAMEQTLRKIKLPDPKVTALPGQQTISKPIEIYGFKETNSLVFIGSQEMFLPVKSLIQKIDIAREQVLLEVLIVEVSADSTNNYGIDWSVSGTGPTGQFNSGTLSSSGLVSNGTLNTSGFNTLLGFSLGFLQGGSGVSALLNANINNKGFTILSAPQILTLNNQEAEINVGQDIPVVTGQLTTDNSSSTTVEYRPTGVTLKFTPNINNGKMVTLKLYGEIKAVSGTSTVGGYSNPQFNKRDIKTSVRVNDNQTLVIGGLVSSDKETNVYKIPVLGDIPLLGYLFKRVEKTVKKQNLMFFITPHIISNQMLADRYTEEMIRKMYNESRKPNGAELLPPPPPQKK